jgi:hypothetical protein
VLIEGPVKPFLIDINPEAILMIDPGTKNGDIFL